MTAVTHLAAQHVEANGRLRQRCAWCGALLFDFDLGRVATPDPVPADWRPATAATGEFWRVDGQVGEAVEAVPHPEKEGHLKIPADSCLNMDPEVTA